MRQNEKRVSPFPLSSFHDFMHCIPFCANTSPSATVAHLTSQSTPLYGHSLRHLFSDLQHPSEEGLLFRSSCFPREARRPITSSKTMSSMCTPYRTEIETRTSSNSVSLPTATKTKLCDAGLPTSSPAAPAGRAYRRRTERQTYVRYGLCTGYGPQHACGS